VSRSGLPERPSSALSALRAGFRFTDVITYLYYTKYAVVDNSIVFRYININIPSFLKTERGGNII